MRRTMFIGALIGVILGMLAPWSGADTTLSAGTDERLIVLIAGEFDARATATAAADEMGFGDIQGFYVAPSDAFDGEPAGRWLLVSAFRTQAGAASFVEIARAAGVTYTRRIVTTYGGTDPIGLGQEPHPDGTGPLLAPLPPGHPMHL